MSKTTAELLLLVALLAGAWLAFGRGVPADAPAVGHTRARPAFDDDPIGAGLVERTRALRAYIAAPPPAAAVRRNPFVFPPPPPPVGRAHATPAIVEAPDDPPRPPIALSGIAEDAGPSGPTRTAVLRSGGQLVFAKEGDRILSRFEVIRIAMDAVQLKDGHGGEVFTLALK